MRQTKPLKVSSNSTRLRQAVNPTRRLPRLLPRNSNSSSTILRPQEEALEHSTNTRCLLRIIRNTTSHRLAARQYRTSLANSRSTRRHSMARLATVRTQVLATQEQRDILACPSSRPVSSRFHKHHNSRSLGMWDSRNTEVLSSSSKS